MGLIYEVMGETMVEAEHASAPSGRPACLNAQRQTVGVLFEAIAIVLHENMMRICVYMYSSTSIIRKPGS